MGEPLNVKDNRWSLNIICRLTVEKSENNYCLMQFWRDATDAIFELCVYNAKNNLIFKLPTETRLLCNLQNNVFITRRFVLAHNAASDKNAAVRSNFIIANDVCRERAQEKNGRV